MRHAHRRSPLRSAAHAFIRIATLLALVAMTALGWVGIQAFRLLSAGLPEVEALARHRPAETTRIFSSDGQLIATLFHENRTAVPLDKVSPRVIHALIAVEDSRFFEHEGVDYAGIVRAGWANLRGGTIEQGASTITMQLARAMFLSQERSFERKAREALLATRIEHRFSKRQILDLYLNHVYFGSGAYGIASAASTYYGRTPDRLTAAQAAMLAGILQAPTRLSPHVDRRAALQRQISVLQRMRDLGFIDGREYQAALREASRAKIRPKGDKIQAMLKYPYFTAHVVAELSKRLPEELLYQGGLRIYTTLDLRLQKQSEAILRQRVRAEGGWYNAHQGALALVENQTGYVRALVGGTGWNDKSQFNRATQALRQPGSSFKAFVYATALERGMTPETVIPDTAITYDAGKPWQWSPKNSDGAYMGAIPMRVALMQSRNVVAVKTLASVGAESVVNTARRMGLKGKLEPYLSLALGAGEATPLEMAAAYSVFPNAGLYRHPVTVKLIVNRDGQVLEDNRHPGARKVLTNATAARMVEMLQRVVTGGTGRAAAVPGHRVAGKTGTTESYRDAWFVGFTPQYSMAVWVGNDDYKPMWQAYGGDLPARIWREAMGAALAGKKPRGFAALAHLPVRTLVLCRTSHKLAGPYCRTTYSERFREGSGPSARCPVHRITPRILQLGSSLQPTSADVDGDGVLTNSDLPHPWETAYGREP